MVLQRCCAACLSSSWWGRRCGTCSAPPAAAGTGCGAVRDGVRVWGQLAGQQYAGRQQPVDNEGSTARVLAGVLRKGNTIHISSHSRNRDQCLPVPPAVCISSHQRYFMAPHSPAAAALCTPPAHQLGTGSAHVLRRKPAWQCGSCSTCQWCRRRRRWHLGRGHIVVGQVARGGWAGRAAAGVGVMAAGRCRCWALGRCRAALCCSLLRSSRTLQQAVEG